MFLFVILELHFIGALEYYYKKSFAKKIKNIGKNFRKLCPEVVL